MALSLIILGRNGLKAKTAPRSQCSSFGTSQPHLTVLLLPLSTVSSLPLHAGDLCLTLPLVGYGGFTVSLSPFFSPTILTFMKTYGVIYTVSNIRGGGEFGEDWHQAGMLDRKVQNLSSVTRTLC